MPVKRRSILGAFALAIFITACLGWLFQSAGKPFRPWEYLLLLALCALLIHALVSLLRNNGRGRAGVRSTDSYEELE